MCDVKQLRLEYNRSSFRQELKSKLGSVCANCGGSDTVEYHHIVPLTLGGTNNLSNIVPLCHVCHQMAHDGRKIRTIFKAERTGRKRNAPPDDYEKIIDRYLHGYIGRKECEKELNLSQGNKLTDKWYFKEYMQRNNIKSYKNKIDLFCCKKNCNEDHTGRAVATIIYTDGTKYEKYIS